MQGLKNVNLPQPSQRKVRRRMERFNQWKEFMIKLAEERTRRIMREVAFRRMTGEIDTGQ